MMATTAILSIRHRIPVITAWSTPGAALIGASSGISIEQAVGAFFLTAVLILVTAAFRPVGALIERIPTAIASAMLAVLVLGVGLAYLFGMTSPVGDLPLSSFVWVRPDFDLATLVGLGVPLYLVTMASQNLPGFAVLKAAGYPVPSRSILAVTGLSSLATAGVGAHTSNLAAITASICTGPDAHPDKDKRWLCGPFYAGGYAILAIFGASLVALFASFPQALIATIAGIALTGPLVNALGASFRGNGDRFAAVVTFAVTASGMSAFGIGSAFWGLVAGLIVFGLDQALRARFKIV